VNRDWQGLARVELFIGRDGGGLIIGGYVVNGKIVGGTRGMGTRGGGTRTKNVGPSRRGGLTGRHNDRGGFGF